MNDGVGDESQGSIVKRSLQPLLDLEDPTKPTGDRNEVDQAKNPLLLRQLGPSTLFKITMTCLISTMPLSRQCRLAAKS